MNFDKGTNLTVTDSAVLELAKQFSGGSEDMMRAFGAAVDSFRYDHMEFFFVDWDMLSVNVGKKGGEYVVSIGTGRSDTYLLDKNADIDAQVSEFNTELDALVAEVEAKLGSDTTNKEIARAANDAICDIVEYSFCENDNTMVKYIRTAYGALVNGKAVCEGYSRLYKAVLDKLGVECELVSGYYIDGEAFEPHMWNYVQDEEGEWYGVDVTMNDGHRLNGRDETSYAKYFWQTEELFAIDHFEDGKVSSVEYEMPYPELHKFWVTPTSSGKFESGYDTSKPGLWFSYDGKSADELAEEGLYMAFRSATTNIGEIEWSEWQSALELERLYQGGVVSDGGKTYFLMPNISMFALDVGIFDIPDDVKGNYSSKYSVDAEKTHLIEKMMVENPAHDEQYIAPAYIQRTEPDLLFQRRQNIVETQHIKLIYTMPLREIGDGLELTWDVSSYNNRDLDLAAVQKNAKLENVKFDGDRTISFDFTPSRAYNHNMIFYDFTVHNMVNVIANDQNGVALLDFSIMYEYKDSIACCKIFNDGRLYVNSYAQPSIAMNGDLSTEGWTYTDTDGTEKKVSEGQRAQMALVVTVPNNSDEMTEAAENKLGDALTKSKTYEIDLNICGKIAKIPEGSYVKLNLGIPDEFASLTGDENIKFKLYHFKTKADGTLDYDNPEEIDCVVTPYGIIAEVNSFSPYMLVAIDNTKLPEEEQDTSKGVALMFNGRGGKVESSISAAGTLKEKEAAVYTLTPDEGYEVEFAALNDKPVTVAHDNTITIAYDELLNSSNTLEVGFVAASVKAAEKAEGIENPNNPGVAEGCTKTGGCILPNGHEGECIVTYTVTFNSNGGSEVADVNVESGASAAEPEAPTRSGYSFDGWFADENLTEKYDFTAAVTSSITLYAKWTKVNNNGGGSSSPSINTNPSKPTDTKPTTPENPPVVWTDSFSDVKEGDWYYSSVKFAVENGLFQGVSETDFSPNTNMTRAMLATVLHRLAKEPAAAAGSAFSDVDNGQWYADGVAWAAENKIILGDNGLFVPGRDITRQELAVMLYRYAQTAGMDVTIKADSLDGYNDASAIADWAADAMSWAVSHGIINGVADGQLAPTGDATRAQVAAMLERLVSMK